jgi:hypothetical protein
VGHPLILEHPGAEISGWGSVDGDQVDDKPTH